MDGADIALDLEIARRGVIGAAGLARGVSRHFAERGMSTLDEAPLPIGRRADLLAVDRRGTLHLVEIKSSLADYRSDGKWPDYAACCDAFYFAVAEDFPRDVLPGDCGLFIADAYGAHLLREAPRRRIAPGMRKRVMLLFGRIAAARLRLIEDKRDISGR
ncbi:MAG: MmcB family DNA repair protein [Alphaproteobacteria bacterium]|nr:MmcB family DNA repair protein [Alphaproteobacteria bacterium]